MDAVLSVDRSRWDGLFPVWYHPDAGVFTTGSAPIRSVIVCPQPTDQIKFGARGDSFYEYLLKQYIQTGGVEMQLFAAYNDTMQGMKKRLWHRSVPNKLAYIAEISVRIVDPTALNRFRNDATWSSRWTTSFVASQASLLLTVLLSCF